MGAMGLYKGVGRGGREGLLCVGIFASRIGLCSHDPLHVA